MQRFESLSVRDKRIGSWGKFGLVVGALTTAASIVWGGDQIADNLCNPKEASAIGGHPQPAAFCDEYSGFQDRVGNMLDSAIPEISIVNDPVFDPHAER